MPYSLSCQLKNLSSNSTNSGCTLLTKCVII
nr:MAG TPA: hypothetical protein [Caudoviricetes sp.]